MTDDAMRAYERARRHLAAASETDDPACIDCFGRTTVEPLLDEIDRLRAALSAPAGLDALRAEIEALPGIRYDGGAASITEPYISKRAVLAALARSQEPGDTGSVCKCGLAKSYHDGRLRAPEEYRPRYGRTEHDR